MKPPAASQKIVQARRDITDEFEKLGQTAKAQITGVEQAPAIGQTNLQIPNPNEFYDVAAYRAKLEADNQKRISQLRAFVRTQMEFEDEQKRARMKMQEEAKRISEAQAQAMTAGKPKEEPKGGILSSLGRAAKRIKGRLGQIGKGKMEKGRAAGG